LKEKEGDRERHDIFECVCEVERVGLCGREWDRQGGRKGGSKRESERQEAK